MTDIMADFKDKLFIIVDNDWDDRFEYLAVLTDIGYWVENLEDLIAWSDLNGCEVLGMTVNVPDDARLSLFILRWL
jgi:hypothetical protein